MNTYVYNQQCAQAAKVVIPQPEGRERQSQDYLGLSLADCDYWLSKVDHRPGGAAYTFLKKAARNVLRYRDDRHTARRIMRKHGIDA